METRPQREKEAGDAAAHSQPEYFKDKIWSLIGNFWFSSFIFLCPELVSLLSGDILSFDYIYGKL